MSKDMGRRSFLKLAGGAVGISALSYYLGATNRIEPTLDNSLPEYADNGLGFPAFRGPYLQKDARLAAFFFNADHERLAALCDRTLNVSESFNYKYVPLTSSVMLVFADMLVSSRDVRDREVGLIPETEVSFWVLTVAMQKTQSGLVPHHLAWFLPYLLVDEGNAIATGREVFGFNKLAAEFQKPVQIQHPDFTATVLGFRQFGADMIAQSEQLLSLSSSSPADVTKTDNLDQIKNNISAGLLRNIQSGPGSGLLEFAARFINNHIPLVFLKQFRDAQNTYKACYQSIIEAPLKVENFFEGGIILNSYTLNIAALESHPLAQNLGLKAGEQRSTLGAWMRVDFALGNGMEV